MRKNELKIKECLQLHADAKCFICEVVEVTEPGRYTVQVIIGDEEDMKKVFKMRTFEDNPIGGMDNPGRVQLTQGDAHFDANASKCLAANTVNFLYVFMEHGLRDVLVKFFGRDRVIALADVMGDEVALLTQGDSKQRLSLYL